MRLTVHTDYSLRVLIYLGINRGRLATIREISEQYGISNNHLLKVVHQLGLRGYIETTRGKKGGVRLAREPERIVIGAVIRDTEQDFSVAHCMGDTRNAEPCRIVGACLLRTALGEAVDAFLTKLDGYTLADLVQPATQLQRLLGGPLPPRT